MLRRTAGTVRWTEYDVSVLAPRLGAQSREDGRRLVGVGLGIERAAAHVADDHVDAPHLRAVAVRVERLRIAEPEVELERLAGRHAQGATHLGRTPARRHHHVEL